MLKWKSAWGVKWHFRDRNKPVPLSPIPRGERGWKKGQSSRHCWILWSDPRLPECQEVERVKRDWCWDRISFLSSALALLQPGFEIETTVRAGWDESAKQTQLIRHRLFDYNTYLCSKSKHTACIWIILERKHIRTRFHYLRVILMVIQFFYLICEQHADNYLLLGKVFFFFLL